MCSDDDTHRWVGCPIRISTDQSLLAAPHGFSQRATSFVASWCQGIHRMPLSRSRPRTRTGTTHTPDRSILLLCRPPDAPVCASGAHGQTAAPLRFSTGTPCDSAQRSLEQSSRTVDETRARPVIPNTLSSLDAPVRIATIIGSDTQSRPRTGTHQPLHTDNEHRNTNSIQQGCHPISRPPVTITRRRSTPAARLDTKLVEADGIEPTTPCLQSRCSAN